MSCGIFSSDKSEKKRKAKVGSALCFVVVSCPMAVSGQRQHTADSGAQVRAAIEHVLADRHGEWRRSPVGSQALALTKLGCTVHCAQILPLLPYPTRRFGMAKS